MSEPTTEAGRHALTVLGQAWAQWVTDIEDEARSADVARLVRTVEEVQAVLSQTRRYYYDADSWEIFVGNQMQKILDIVTPAEETPAEALNHAIHDATGYKP